MKKVKISNKHLIRAARKIEKMGRKRKELLCDDIYKDQPNLLGSVLVLGTMGEDMNDVDILLHILMTLYLTLKEAKLSIPKISEQTQAQELKKLTESVKFQEGMGDSMSVESVKQYISSHKQSMLLGYVVSKMNDSGFQYKSHENSKYLMMVGINLVNCISSEIERA